MVSEVLERLNLEQKIAVEHDEGPLFIVAGAGTGKTKVITSRISYLMLEKKVSAESILALTFTEKAAEEMSARVDELLPLSYEEVMIKTFHGFCDWLLREKGSEIGLDPGYKLLDSAQQWLFLKRNLFAMELDYYRPLGNPQKFIRVLLGHFSRLKDEDVSPEKYQKYAKDLLEKSESDADREEAEKMLEVAEAYEQYQKLMIENNYLDFGDLQYYALQLLEKRPSVLREMQNRFKYVMVDEFQDTNYAQMKVVLMLAKDHGNLTVVGDDDQSIYKWRGASLSNIKAFEKSYPDATKVVLSENYRSTQQILDASYALIQNNNPYRLEVEAGINKKLKGQVQGEEVQVKQFGHYLEEVRFVVGEIERKAGDGISYGDMAILVRANSHAMPYVELLRDKGIPFSVRDTKGVWQQEIVKNVMAYLHFLAKPHYDVAFFRLLSLPLFDISMSEVLESVRKARNSDFKPLFYYLRDVLRDDGQDSLPGLEGDREKLKEVWQMFSDLLDFQKGKRLGHVIREFLERSGYYKSLTAVTTHESTEMLVHLSQFSEVVRGFELSDPDGSLKDFLEFAASMEEADGGSTATVADSDEAVSILTVHSSKGLEFDTVFVPTLVKNRFPSIKRSDPLPIPEDLLEENLPSEDTHLQEERRLFYVACTRAKSSLILSYSELYEGSRKWKVSPFVEEIVAEGLAVESLVDGENDNKDAEAREHGGLTVNVEQPQSDLEKKLESVPKKPTRSLSYSRLDAFGACPLKYKFRYMFNVATPTPHAANFGSSVHNAVNDFYQAVKDGKQPTIDLLMDHYEKSWINAGYESKGHEEARKMKGREMMELFFKNEAESSFKLPAFLERPFRVKVGKVMFNGRIDRIDQLEDGTYEVIDYKTGSSKRKTNLEKDLQLSLYALAVKEVFRLQVSKLSLYFLDDGLKVSTERKVEDLGAVREELEEKAGELMGSEFKPTPGWACGFCEYKPMCHAAV